MEESFRKEMQHITGHGLISVMDDKKVIAMQQKKRTWISNIYYKLKYIISNKCHASILYRKDPKDFLTESHLTKIAGKIGIYQNKFNFKSYLYSDLYRINLTKLIEKNNIKKLERLYGSEWKEIISDKYLSIQRKLHDQGIVRVSNAQYTEGNRFRKIAFGNVIKRGIISIFKKKNIKKSNFKKIHERMIGDFYNAENSNSGKTEMICSEFAARCVIAGLMELNVQLTKEYNNNPKFQSLDDNHNFIKIPIKENQSLKYITPESLITILEEHNCLDKMPHPELIENTVKF